MKAVKTIFSLMLIALVLVSSTSFMVGIHHCGGHVKNVALFDKAAGCEMELQLPPCHREAGNSCCRDLTVVHQDQDFNSTPSSFELFPIFPEDVLVTTILLAEIVPASAPSPKPVYHPPLLSVDRPVDLRVFLI